jgi:hypothetical protein
LGGPQCDIKIPKNKKQKNKNEMKITMHIPIGICVKSKITEIPSRVF